ncbi:MAG: putative signal transduction protein containing EAL and modified HD-GYP domain [Gammaproteobacteria bacterium]|nr:MAG: putative signal transduction protein containing EAL and modified HD-GYP domain [Gammaproteobacteria bacterium]TND06798.1 MAG: putative signal transduction protein containing EAL and modified HD-GYP domain [Gammaproteobacteria bacterium]
MNNIFIGRQPIYDQDLQVHAYELLYRDSSANAATHTDDDMATAQVVVNAFMDFGLDRIVGDHQAFINMPRSYLVGDLPLPFPPEQVVLEILETTPIDARLIKAVRELAERGFTIALDDFIYHDKLKPLVEISDIIKIDFMQLSPDEIRDHLVILKDHKVKLLAEKLETPGDFKLAADLGFDYFQGFFFCKPNVVESRTITPNRLAILQLLAALQNPDAGIADVEKIISTDVSLSYKVLRYLNSALYSLPRKIESIRHAIVYVGLPTIKNWFSLVALSKIDDKPQELVATALVRARMCELMAPKEKSAEMFFTVGLLSVLDALLDQPMPQIMRQLPLAVETKTALLNHTGPAGHALACVLAYERCEWEKLEAVSRSVDLTKLFVEAVDWANAAVRQLASGEAANG